MIALYVALGFSVAIACFIFLAPGSATTFAFSIDRKLAGLKLKRQDIADFTMPYMEGGKGEALILIHGFGGDKDNFTRMAGRLTKRFRIIIPDLPGFGDATSDPSAQYRMSDQVAAPIASGWSEFAGWDFHPLESAAFARRTSGADSGMISGHNRCALRMLCP